VIDYIKIKIAAIVSHLGDDVFRIPLIGFIAWMLCPDIGSVLGYVLGLATVLLAVTHFWRRLLVPYVKLKDFAAKAKQEPLSASVVYASTLIAITMIFSTVVNLVQLIK